MFYLTTHSTHFIYGYMASDIWLRTILIVREETRCRHIGYSYRLTARVLFYAPSHRQDNTYHGLCYNSRGALAGTRNITIIIILKKIKKIIMTIIIIIKEIIKIVKCHVIRIIMFDSSMLLATESSNSVFSQGLYRLQS